MTAISGKLLWLPRAKCYVWNIQIAPPTAMSEKSLDSTAQDTSLDAQEIAATIACHHAAWRSYQEIFDLWSNSGSRRETTHNDYWKVLRSFADFLKRKELTAVLRLDVIAFRDYLLANSQSATTVSRKIGILKTLFRVAIDYERLAANPADNVRVVSGQQPKPRIAFTVDDLNRIFHSPVYTERFRPKGGGGEACYWLPLLALFTGCRVEELAQLLVDDIHHEEGLGHYLNITDEAAHSKLKNASSRRRLPLHSALLDCGFLDYVESARPRRFVFPGLKPNPRDKLGGYFSNWFSGYLRHQVGITDKRKVLHSFRHSFKDICRNVGIDEAVHDALTGHTAPGAGRKYGNEQYPLPPLFDAMERFEVAGLDLDHLYTRPPTHKLQQAESHMISAYYGVVIALCKAKDSKQINPFIFARCQGNEAAISISDNQIIFGDLPSPKRHLVHAWVEIHREELVANWELGRNTGEFFRIDPLR